MADGTSNRGIRSGQTNAAGKKVADVAAEEELADLEKQLDERQTDVERTREFTSVLLSRMRTEWTGEYRTVMARVNKAVDDVMYQRYLDAYVIMNDLYEVVRLPEVDEDGVVVEDEHGFPRWQRTEVGSYIEDYSLLTKREREDFLFRISTRLFEWQQDAAGLWGEAMFAKAVWSESFSHHFDAPMKGTVDDRTARGNLGSADEKYFALYLSTLSRRAEALCSSMERLALRLKDVLAT